MASTPDLKEIEKALKGSGFPYQTAVRCVIDGHRSGYKVNVSEYPWSNSKKEDGFLDLVASNRDFVLTVECKKTRQEKYFFLLPLGSEGADNVSKVTCLWIPRYDDPGRIPAVNWAELELQPFCPSSEFCVVSINSNPKNNPKSNNRMLERDAAILVNGSDAFTKDFKELHRMNMTPPYPIVPILVTNAELYTVRYNPADVSLLSGEFDQLPGDIEPVSWVRFHKTLISGRGHDLGLRTIFIVNALSLNAFLNELKEIVGQSSGQRIEIQRQDLA